MANRGLSYSNLINTIDEQTKAGKSLVDYLRSLGVIDEPNYVHGAADVVDYVSRFGDEASAMTRASTLKNYHLGLSHTQIESNPVTHVDMIWYDRLERGIVITRTKTETKCLWMQEITQFGII